MTIEDPKNIREFLEHSCLRVKRLEADAAQALQSGQEASYRALMLEKAQTLAHLERQGQPFLSDLPPDMQAGVARRLREFSSSAFNAISLDSVFYMSCLLYPEDYVPGNPNDLEIFTDSITLNQ